MASGLRLAATSGNGRDNSRKRKFPAASAPGQRPRLRPNGRASSLADVGAREVMPRGQEDRPPACQRTGASSLRLRKEGAHLAPSASSTPTASGPTIGQGSAFPALTSAASCNELLIINDLVFDCTFQSDVLDPRKKSMQMLFISPADLCERLLKIEKKPRGEPSHPSLPDPPSSTPSPSTPTTQASPKWPSAWSSRMTQPGSEAGKKQGRGGCRVGTAAISLRRGEPRPCQVASLLCK